MKILILLFLLSVTSYKIVTKPTSNTYSFKGNFYWKIGRSSQFKQNKLNRILFDDLPLCVYRDKMNRLIFFFGSSLLRKN